MEIDNIASSCIPLVQLGIRRNNCNDKNNRKYVSNDVTGIYLVTINTSVDPFALNEALHPPRPIKPFWERPEFNRQI